MYDEVTEDIFVNRNVGFFLKKNEKKKMGMFTLRYAFGQLSSVKRLAYGTFAIPKYL